VGLLKRPESQPDPAVAHHAGEPDPYQIIDEKRFFQNRPQGCIEMFNQTNSKPIFFATRFLHPEMGRIKRCGNQLNGKGVE